MLNHRIIFAALAFLMLGGCGAKVPQPPEHRVSVSNSVQKGIVQISGQPLAEGAVFSKGTQSSVRVAGIWTAKPPLTTKQPESVDLIIDVIARSKKGNELAMGNFAGMKLKWTGQQFEGTETVTWPKLSGKYAFRVRLEAFYADLPIEKFWICDTTIEIQ